MMKSLTLAWAALFLVGTVPPVVEGWEPAKPLAPADYLTHLTKHVKTGAVYTPGFDGPAPAEVREADLAGLLKLLENKEPCSASIKAGLAKRPPASTVGHEAGVLLDSYRLDKPYPIAEASTDHKVDPKVIKAWHDDRKRGFDIRLLDGSVVIPSDAIVAYHWNTHTMKLRRGWGEALSKSIHGKGKALTVPFAACVDGKPLYEGQFVSPLSSQSYKKVSVVFNLDPSKLDQAPIARGYAVDESKLAYPDPRPDERIKASFKAAGKLR